MKIIPAALNGYVGSAAGAASSLGAGLSLGGKFADRIHGQNNPCDARDTTLVDGRDVVPHVIVIDTVDLPVHLIGPRAIDRAESSDIDAAKARLHANQLREVAAGNRNRIHNRVIDSHALRLRGGVER